MKKKLQLLNLLFYLPDQRLNEIPMLVSVRKGFTYMIPLVMLGSFALMILSLPVPPYQKCMTNLFGDSWINLLLYVRDGTLGLIAVFMVICISYSYVDELGNEHNVSPIIAAMVSLASFIAISGVRSEYFSLEDLGVNGLFIAVIIASASSYLFVKLSSIRFLKVRAYTMGANATFNFALASIFPAVVTVSVFAAVSSVLTAYFHVDNIHFFIQETLSSVFLKIESPFLSSLMFVFLIHVLWFLGIHGSNVLEPAVVAILVPGIKLNESLIQSGMQPQFVFTKAALDCFVLMGGCGASICLVAAILIAGKYKNKKGLAKLSFLPVMFNINELIVFGIPIVFNPIYLIPFIGVPILLTVITYLAILLGLVPYTIHPVAWTTPILLGGYAATGSVRGSLLQLFNFVIGTLCYIPFVRLSESASKEQLEHNLQRVYTAHRLNEERGYPSNLLSRHDEIGNIAKLLAADLGTDMKNNKIALHYQPQIDYEGNVFGVEALLRWEHETYGHIYPPLVIALAEESSLINGLGQMIFSRSVTDLKNLREAGFRNIALSVNVSASQLEDDEFIPKLKRIMDENGIPNHSLKIEITEQIALTGSKKIIRQIDRIKDLGIKLAMDDFGMGHSSLKYLKEYEFDTIKLDGSLVREVASSANCRNIISSIIYLSKSMNCTIIAEYVEAEDQKAALYELGCDRFQGHLYSKPLPYEKLIEYLT